MIAGEHASCLLSRREKFRYERPPLPLLFAFGSEFATRTGQTCVSWQRLTRNQDVPGVGARVKPRCVSVAAAAALNRARFANRPTVRPSVRPSGGQSISARDSSARLARRAPRLAREKFARMREYYVIQFQFFFNIYLQTGTGRPHQLELQLLRLGFGQTAQTMVAGGSSSRSCKWLEDGSPERRTNKPPSIT